MEIRVWFPDERGGRKGEKEKTQESERIERKGKEADG